MRKTILLPFLILGLAVPAMSETATPASKKPAKKQIQREPAQSKKTLKGKTAPAAKKTGKLKPAPKPAPAASASAPARSNMSAPARQQLQRALEMARGGQYQPAANALFSLGRRGELGSERAQIKYVLGLMLMEMNLNQVAAFQFVDVIRLNHPKYTRLAVEKLSIVADGLGDDTLLNYAINRLDVKEVPAANRDMIWFRMGEVKMKGKDFNGAEASFAKVQPGSSYYNQALYNRGLALLEKNRVDEALDSFRTMLSVRSRAGVTDTNRVAAQLAIARALYQKKDWDGAIEAYSQVPRDHALWHDALFEQSWAMFRAARFRSTLSNFQSLHSAYYEDFYIPESLLLRAIVYLYVCKYDEMEKVLQLFEKTYGPVSGKLRDFLRTNSDPNAYWAEMDKWSQAKAGREGVTTRLPALVLNSVIDQGNVRRSFNYLKALDDERAKVQSNDAFRASPLGQYALKIIGNRRKNTQLAIGDMVKVHLLNMRTELRDLYEQAGFIRYEMINGKKEVLKKKIAGKDLEQTVDEDVTRSFYVQNGFEYYPFQGEYWLDEIGNYHYLGKSSCE